MPFHKYHDLFLQTLYPPNLDVSVHNLRPILSEHLPFEESLLDFSSVLLSQELDLIFLIFLPFLNFQNFESFF